MLDILIISHFTQIPGEAGNSRFNYIAERIDKSKSQVEIVTSSFSHNTKRQRELPNKLLQDTNYTITLLKETGYKKNISIKRFISHRKMGNSLKTYLKNRKKPDVIYCSVPSLSVAKVAAMYAKKNKVRFIVDIQDLWPEAFKMAFNIPLISDLVLYPLKRQSEYIYKRADNIVAVSETYIKKALASINENENKNAISVYLGTDLKTFDNIIKDQNVSGHSKDEIKVVYIGTLSHSYDIKNIIKALSIIKSKRDDKVKLIVMGDGPLKNEFEAYAKENKINSKFTGSIDYSEMVSILLTCDIAVNPIKAGSAGSIINKVGDYAAAGLPVINTQESTEYRKLLEEYQAGINCYNEDAEDIAKKLIVLIKDEKLRKKMGSNNRKLAEEKFDRKKTYKEIINLIEGDRK